MTRNHYASYADVEPPTYASTDAVRVLSASGISASRERVTRMADELFGWPADGRRRRITASEMSTLLEVFTLVDQVGLTRSLVVALYVSEGDIPDNISDGLEQSERVLTAAVSTVQAGRDQFRASSDPAERIEAAHRIRDAVATLQDAADSLVRVRRLVAA